jgi:hypothetical protein
MQKYTAMAMMTGTRPARSPPKRLAMSPTNQTRIKRKEIASALPLR